jgi:hypothetical protein
MDRIVRFEQLGDRVVAVDESGKRFATAAGKFDWRPHRARCCFSAVHGGLGERRTSAAGRFLPGPGRRSSAMTR